MRWEIPLISCFHRYTPSLKVGKSNILTVLGASKPKGLKRIAKIGLGRLCMRVVTVSMYYYSAFPNLINATIPCEQPSIFLFNFIDPQTQHSTLFYV
jgi:hypothetical protein